MSTGYSGEKMAIWEREYLNNKIKKMENLMSRIDKDERKELYFIAGEMVDLYEFLIRLLKDR